MFKLWSFGSLKRHCTPQRTVQTGSPSNGSTRFVMRRFANLNDVSGLKPGEALLIHKYTYRKKYSTPRTAEAGLRQVVNGRGFHLWITTTKRGHLLVFRKPAHKEGTALSLL